MRWPRLPGWVEALLDEGFLPYRDGSQRRRNRRPRRNALEPLEPRHMLTLYWAAGNATWDTSSANWSASPGGQPSLAWGNGSDADFIGPSATVAIATGTTLTPN